MSSSSSSSSSFLSVWGRGIPTDQLTPKASARSGTSTEPDPFDSTTTTTTTTLQQQQPIKPQSNIRSNLASFLPHSNPSSPAPNPNQTFKSSIPTDDLDLNTPMPQASPINPNYFSPLNPSSNPPQSMATTALKALTTTTSSSSSQSQQPPQALFKFTTKPITRFQKNTNTPPPPPPTNQTLHQPSLSTAEKNSITLPPQGLLSVKIISAKSLKFAASHSRPYVFAQFDNSEFASREPIGEEEKESKGVVISTNNPNGTTSSTLSGSDSVRSGSDGAHIASSPLSHPSSSNNSSKLFPPSSSIAGSGSYDHKVVNPPDGNGAYCLSGQNPIWKQEVDFDVTQSQQSSKTLYVSVYDRSAGDTLQQQPSPLATLAANHLPIPGIEGIEMFLGEAEIKLDLDALSKAGCWVDQWYPLTMKNVESVDPLEAGTIRIQLKYKERKSKKSLDVSDFEFLKMIGKGTFGRVFQVRKKDTRRIYAMKVLSKKEVIDKKEVQHTIGERNILQQSSLCPFLLGLKFSFQSPGELFLVMDYKSGGELFHHLQKEGRFTEERARFYTAEIILALEHLHKYNIVYRDLKPENILLDATGHIVLCDFGLSKPNLNPDELTTTFCGTTEYLAPEVLLDDHGYSKLVDFWSLGVLLFEMCCGWSPFYAEDNQQMYKNICFGKIKFPRGVIGDDGKQFVKGLLNRNPKHRLGSQNDTEDLKKHEFFVSIDWQKLSARQIIPTFKPHIESDESVSNFDSEFTQLNIEDHLPMTMKERMLGERVGGSGGQFDEADRSNDWVKQASYVTTSHLLGAHSTKKNLLYSPTVGPAVVSCPLPLGTPAPPRAAPDLPASPPPNPPGSAAPRPDTSPPSAALDDHPGALALKPKADDQDHFLGFSYHGESELIHLAHHDRSSAASLRGHDDDDDDDDRSASPSSP